MTTPAVLLMAYGAPSSLDDVESYLLDVRGGRETPPELVAEVRSRYAAIGRSPLPELTLAQSRAVERHLAAAEPEGGWKVWAAMRHSRPTIAEVVSRIADAGRHHLLAVCLAPQYSRLSVGEYFHRLDEALAATGAGLTASRIASWYAEPLFLEGLAVRLREALEALPPRERDDTRILFTAHSLPERIADEGDPYPQQVTDTARAVAALAGVEIHAWALAYQSAGARAEPWLGPSLEEAMAEAAADGCRGVLVAPVGFVCDNVEILYDIDLEARCIAAGLGLALRRTASLNDSPLLAEALAQRLLATAREEAAAWRAS